MHSADYNANAFRLCGELTIQTIAEAHKKFSQILEGESAIVIDVSGVENADLTLVQLIEAARCSAARRSKVIRLSAPAEGKLREVLERGGFLHNAGDGFWTCNMGAQ